MTTGEAIEYIIKKGFYRRLLECIDGKTRDTEKVESCIELLLNEIKEDDEKRID